MPFPHPPQKPRVRLQEWIWRAFVQGALIPLILVELVLISIYLAANAAIRESQTHYLNQVAFSELAAAAHRETHLIDEQLSNIHNLTLVYRELTQQALTTPAETPDALTLAPDGIRYSLFNTGGAASFYSNITPPEHQNLDKVARLQRLDPFMRSVQTHNDAIANIYFNSWDSYNRIYPWFFSPDQYPHNLHIPSFNFYYLADAEHNPNAEAVWTEVYLDPAGKGWMMSSIAPVYQKDFLEGVVGLDISLNSLLSELNHLDIPWDGYCLLVSPQGDIMALPKAGERDFDLKELTTASYTQPVQYEVLKPQNFNLHQHPETQALAQRLKEQREGMMQVTLAHQEKLVAWNTVPQTGWSLLSVVDEEQVYQETNLITQEYRHIGYGMIAGLVGFYVLFFIFLWLRARHLSKTLTKPIRNIQNMMADIGRGIWTLKPRPSAIRELNDMALHIATVGHQLELSEHQRLKIQQRLSMVLDNATETLWERDDRIGRIFLRGHFCQRFGLFSDSLSEAHFLERIHPDDLPLFRTAQVELRRHGVGEVEFRFRDRDQQYHWLLGRGHVIERDSEGTARLLAGTYVDIDHIKQTQANLRQATQEAEAASQAKSRFISSVTHELRTPLNAIQGFAQLIELECTAQPSAPRAAELGYVREILNAGHHLNALINDVLDWTRLQAERPKLDKRRIAVQELLNDCLELVRLEAEQHGLSLRLQPTDESLCVETDPRRLRQVILNLLSNAIKYNRPQGRIELSAFAQPDWVRITVADTGWGIPSEWQTKLFEPFQRLGKENTAIQGTGIGLCLCRDLAQLLGGRLGLHSVPNQGSQFWIELPAAPCLQESESSLINPEPEGTPHPILCVAPAETLTTLCQILDATHPLCCAQTAQEALQHARTLEPALLVIDPNLPDMSAEHFLDLLSGHRYSVIALISPEGLDLLNSLSVQGLVTYPIDPEVLRDQVTALLLPENTQA